MQLDDLTDQQLLKMRLCDLPVRIEGSLLEPRLKRLFEELRSRRIRFRPYYWLSEEWFTPDGVPGFAIPFYLAHPRLTRLERAQMKQAEGSTEAECMRILRHETGHALGNAFRVDKRKTWKDTFGSFETPYPDWYQPQPYSRDYVLNLDAWYAQAHPAEDFAETFAVWLDPRNRWRTQYGEWGAMRKLEYVERLMKELSSRKARPGAKIKVDPLKTIRMTLRQYYMRKRSYYAIDWAPSYDGDLLRAFSAEPRHRRFPSAFRFIQSVQRDICRIVAKGTGVHMYTINYVAKQMIERCRELDLYVTVPQREARPLVTALLTAETMRCMQTGYHRIRL
jgi:hypothetical protein